MKKVIVLVLLGLSLIFLNFNAFAHFNASADIKKAEHKVVVNQPTKKVSIFACGDIMFHSDEIQSAKTNHGYDFNSFFLDIKEEIAGKSLSIGNFESTINPKLKPSGYPAFNTPKEAVSALHNAGFDVLVASNNHSLDTGLFGLMNTKKEIEKNKIKCVGIGDTKNAIIEKNGIRIGVLAYTYGTNLGKKYSNYLNYIDNKKIQNDIKNTRKKCDFIIVYLHTGNEYNRIPEKYQLDLVNSIAKYGADAILCSHPHVARKSGMITVGSKKVFVNYSMGNFISSQNKAYTDIGTISELNIIKKGRNTYIDSAETKAVYRLRYKEGKTKFKTVLADKIDKYGKYISKSYLSYIKRTASQYRFVYN